MAAIPLHLPTRSPNFPIPPPPCGVVGKGCCCCAPLRAGAIIYAAAEIFCGISALFNIYEEAPKTFSGPIQALIALFGGFLYTSIGIAGLYGVLYKKIRFLYVWLISQVLGAAFLAAIFIAITIINLSSFSPSADATTGFAIMIVWIILILILIALGFQLNALIVVRSLCFAFGVGMSGDELISPSEWVKQMNENANNDVHADDLILGRPIIDTRGVDVAQIHASIPSIVTPPSQAGDAQQIQDVHLSFPRDQSLERV